MWITAIPICPDRARLLARGGDAALAACRPRDLPSPPNASNCPATRRRPAARARGERRPSRSRREGPRHRAPAGVEAREHVADADLAPRASPSLPSVRGAVERASEELAHHLRAADRPQLRAQLVAMAWRARASARRRAEDAASLASRPALAAGGSSTARRRSHSERRHVPIRATLRHRRQIPSASRRPPSPTHARAQMSRRPPHPSSGLAFRRRALSRISHDRSPSGSPSSRFRPLCPRWRRPFASVRLLVACSVAGLPPLPEDYFVVLADAHVDGLYDANLTRACKCPRSRLRRRVPLDRRRPRAVARASGRALGAVGCDAPPRLLAAAQREARRLAPRLRFSLHRRRGAPRIRARPTRAEHGRARRRAARRRVGRRGARALVARQHRRVPRLRARPRVRRRLPPTRPPPPPNAATARDARRARARLRLPPAANANLRARRLLRGRGAAVPRRDGASRRRWRRRRRRRPTPAPAARRALARCESRPRRASSSSCSTRSCGRSTTSPTRRSAAATTTTAARRAGPDDLLGQLDAARRDPRAPGSARRARAHRRPHPARPRLVLVLAVLARAVRARAYLAIVARRASARRRPALRPPAHRRVPRERADDERRRRSRRARAAPLLVVGSLSPVYDTAPSVRVVALDATTLELDDVRVHWAAGFGEAGGDGDEPSPPGCAARAAYGALSRAVAPARRTAVADGDGALDDGGAADGARAPLRAMLGARRARCSTTTPRGPRGTLAGARVSARLVAAVRELRRRRRRRALRGGACRRKLACAQRVGYFARHWKACVACLEAFDTLAEAGAALEACARAGGAAALGGVGRPGLDDGAGPVGAAAGDAPRARGRAGGWVGLAAAAGSRGRDRGVPLARRALAAAAAHPRRGEGREPLPRGDVRHAARCLRRQVAVALRARRARRALGPSGGGGGGRRRDDVPVAADRDRAAR